MVFLVEGFLLGVMIVTIIKLVKQNKRLKRKLIKDCLKFDGQYAALNDLYTRGVFYDNENDTIVIHDNLIPIGDL